MKQLCFALIAVLLSANLAADPVWIDVRSSTEYAADHIAGDSNVPLAELDTQALAERYGKDAELKLYCRSGNRAGQALELLKAAGFTNVSNEGGIADVRALRGIAQQSPAVGAGNAAPAAQ